MLLCQGPLLLSDVLYIRWRLTHQSPCELSNFSADSQGKNDLSDHSRKFFLFFFFAILYFYLEVDQISLSELICF